MHFEGGADSVADSSDVGQEKEPIRMELLSPQG